MNNSSNASSIAPDLMGWLFGTAVIIIGLLNMFLVHPVPGIAYLLLSFIYLPPASSLLKQWFGFSLPAMAKVALGIVIIMFTLGVSDLGDMIDKL